MKSESNVVNEFKTYATQNLVVSIKFPNNNHLEMLDNFVDILYKFGDYKDEELKKSSEYIRLKDRTGIQNPINGMETEKIHFEDFIESDGTEERLYRIFPDKHCELELYVGDKVEVDMDGCEYPSELTAENITSMGIYFITDKEKDVEGIQAIQDFIQHKMEVLKEVTDFPIDLSGLTIELKKIKEIELSEDLEITAIDKDEYMADRYDDYENR